MSRLASWKPEPDCPFRALKSNRSVRMIIFRCIYKILRLIHEIEQKLVVVNLVMVNQYCSTIVVIMGISSIDEVLIAYVLFSHCQASMLWFYLFYCNVETLPHVVRNLIFTLHRWDCCCP